MVTGGAEDGRFNVRYTPGARDDLLRLFDFLLERAQTTQDLDYAQHAIDALAEAVERQLSRTPFIYRKSGDSPFLREIIVPAGNTGYVMLYEIEDASTVTVLAVRHQREDDYH
jgi:plasmid stabilization system protein ParE